MKPSGQPPCTRGVGTGMVGVYILVGVAKVNGRDLPTPVKPSGRTPCTRGVGTGAVGVASNSRLHKK